MQAAAGVLWSVTSLSVAAGAAIAVPTALAAGPTSLLTVAAALLLVGACALLAMMLVTLARRDAYDAQPTLETLPALVAWPIRVGWWIGGAVIFLAQLVIALTTPGGGDVRTSSRFAMSLMAVFGMVASLFTAPVLPDAALLGLFGLWGAVIVVAVVRGACGWIARAAR